MRDVTTAPLSSSERFAPHVFRSVSLHLFVARVRGAELRVNRSCRPGHAPCSQPVDTTPRDTEGGAGSRIQESFAEKENDMKRIALRGKLFGTVARIISATVLVMMLGAGAMLTSRTVRAEQPPSPCHPNPNAAADMDFVSKRGDIRHLPDPLKSRLVRLADRPHSQLPTQAYAEAPTPSQLFQYYL